MKSLLSKVLAMAGLVALFGGVGMVAAPAASAAVTCGSISVGATQAVVSCNGSGQFRMVQTCLNTLTSYYTTKYGSWLSAGSWGVSTYLNYPSCTGLAMANRVTIERR